MSQQIFRHGAVVLAGMASIGFTVAAGTYIVNQIATDQPGAGARRSHIESGAAAPTQALPQQAADPARAELSGVTVRFVAETRALPAVAAIAPPAAIVPPPARPVGPVTAAVHESTGLSGRLGLLGDTYVGANLTRPRPDSVSMTVDTNLLAALANRPDTSAESVGPTRLRTDLDVKHGEITLAVSDPLLGQHAVQLSPRRADPAPVTPEAELTRTYGPGPVAAAPGTVATVQWNAGTGGSGPEQAGTAAA